MAEQQPGAGARQRIDKWLFFARLAKSRSLAQDQIASGLVLVNDKPASQPSQLLKPGDRLVLKRPRGDMIVVVRGAGERRGPYEEARLLYDDVTPPPDPDARLTTLEQAMRLPGTGRPSKKERRALDRLRPGLDED